MALLRAPRAAVTFLTRIPLPAGGLGPQDMGRSLPFFPLVGLLLGGTLAGAAQVATPHVAPHLLATGLVALLALLTGGLHLDGLADTFDGLSGGRGDRSRTLEIMRDGRSGPHGVTALVLVIAGKILALAHALSAPDLLAVALAPAVARGVVVGLVVLFPYARAEGLGRAFRGHASAAGLASAWILTAVLVGTAGWRLLIPALCAFAAAFLVAAVLARRLGGLTGDVYGAAIELGELAFLAAAHLK